MISARFLPPAAVLILVSFFLPGAHPALEALPGGAIGHRVAAARPALDLDVILYQGDSVLGGRRVRLSALWTQKPLVLNFWAGLCPPCRQELPAFQQAYDAGAREKVFLLGVDVGPFLDLGSREEGIALLRELKITFPAGMVIDPGVVRAYRLLGMPTTVFITKGGKILRHHTGELTRSQIEGFISELVSSSGGS